MTSSQSATLSPPPDVDMRCPGWCGGPALALPRVQLDGVVLALVPVMYYLATSTT